MDARFIQSCLHMDKMAGKYKTPVWARRVELGLTQQKVAKKAGLEIRTYRDVEHCIQRGYNSSTLVCIANALEISPATLYEMIYS